MKRTVALYTSAWIEMILLCSHTHQLVVALYTSAWIEIYNRIVNRIS